MELIVYIPTPWRKLTRGQARVVVEAETIHQVVESLELAFPGLEGEICQGNGRIREHINVFINGEEIRSLAGEDTPLCNGVEVAFIPAMAGGAQSCCWVVNVILLLDLWLWGEPCTTTPSI